MSTSKRCQQCSLNSISIHENVEKACWLNALLCHVSWSTQPKSPKSACPVRQPDEVFSIQAVIGPVVEQYSKLLAALLDQPPYSPLCLNDFAPLEYYRSKLWLSNLSLPYEVKRVLICLWQPIGNSDFYLETGQKWRWEFIGQGSIETCWKTEVFVYERNEETIIAKYGS